MPCAGWAKANITLSKPMFSVEYKSPLGPITLESDGKAITSVQFHSTTGKNNGPMPPVLKEALQQLSQYFQGKRKDFQLPLAPKGTPFQQEVWHLVAQIPWGKTITYGKVAAQLGDIKKIRAAAAAIGKNPCLILIPCHRVLGADGKLTGYAGGIEKKKALLTLEKAAIFASQQTLF